MCQTYVIVGIDLNLASVAVCGVLAKDLDLQRSLEVNEHSHVPDILAADLTLASASRTETGSKALKSRKISQRENKQVGNTTSIEENTELLLRQTEPNN